MHWNSELQNVWHSNAFATLMFSNQAPSVLLTGHFRGKNFNCTWSLWFVLSRYGTLIGGTGWFPGITTRADGFPVPWLLPPEAVPTAGLLSLAEFSAFRRIRIVNRGGESGATRTLGDGSRSRDPDSEFVPAVPKVEEVGGTWSNRIWSTIHDKSSLWRVDLNKISIMLMFVVRSLWLMTSSKDGAPK